MVLLAFHAKYNGICFSNLEDLRQSIKTVVCVSRRSSVLVNDLHLVEYSSISSLIFCIISFEFKDKPIFKVSF